MASIMGFRTRAASRDQETDTARFSRIDHQLRETAAEIGAERAGLEKRRGTASADAAFLLDAIGNEEVATRSSTRVGALTNELVRGERRTVDLLRQLDLVSDLRAQVATFLNKMAR